MEEAMSQLEAVARRTRVVVAASAIALLTGAASAHAASCVRVDAARDTLSPEEQKAALLLFEAALGAEGQVVDPGTCSDEWVLSHVRLGSSITVAVASPRGRRSDRVSSVEELGAQYSQTIRALLSGGDPRDELTGVVDRTNVTSAERDLRRVPSENLFLVRIGYGYAAGPGNGGGPSLGLGWRRELNRVALEVSFANALVLAHHTDGYSSDPLNGGPFTPVAVGVSYHFQPLANGTPYAGVGAGYTIWGIDPNNDMGLDVRLSLGYEALRASTLRLFVQADVALPTYRVARKSWDPEGWTNGERSWPASVSLSLGIGFGGRPDGEARD
jgi:hypothetical protein